MADLAELLTRLSYLQAGGREKGQRDIDKIGGIFNTITDTSNQVISNILAIKKAQYERQKAQEEIAASQNKRRLIKEGFGTTPISGQTAGLSIPSQTAGLEDTVITTKPTQSATPEIFRPYGEFSADQAVDMARTEIAGRKEAEPKKQGNLIYVDRRTGKELRREPTSLGTGDKIILIGEGTSPSDRPLSAEAAKNIENARSGIRAIDDMLAELKINPLVYIKAGAPGGELYSAIEKDENAQRYNRAKAEVIDVITRLRTGAALNQDEQKTYTKLVTSILRSPTVTVESIKKVRQFFSGLEKRIQSGKRGDIQLGENKEDASEDVLVISPKGQRGYVTREELQDALNQGYRMAQ